MPKLPIGPKRGYSFRDISRSVSDRCHRIEELVRRFGAERFVKTFGRVLRQMNGGKFYKRRPNAKLDVSGRISWEDVARHIAQDPLVTNGYFPMTAEFRREIESIPDEERRRIIEKVGAKYKFYMQAMKARR